VNANSSSSDGGNVDVNGGKLGLYGTWWKEGTYVQGYAGGGFDSFDTRRTISLPGYTAGGMTPGATGGSNPGDAGYRIARGDTDGGEANANLAIGHDWKFGHLIIGPTAGVQYDYIGINGYNETGADTLDLSLRPQTAQSLQSLIGFHASCVLRPNETQTVVPYVSVQWEHEYLDGDRAIGAALEGQNFNVESTAFGRDGILLDLGMTVNWSERVSTYLGYQGELGRSHYNSNSFFGGIRISF